MRVSRALVLLVVGALGTRPAAAQDARGASVAGGVSATNIESSTTASVSGAFEYRLTPIVGLEVEAALTPTLKGPFPQQPLTIADPLAGLPATTIIQVFPSAQLTNLGGRMVAFTNAVRLRFPTGGAPIEPFFVAGGGVASLRRDADLVYSFPILTLPGVPPAPLRTINQHLTVSEVDLALTIGGGIGIRAARRLWVDVDLRMLRLMGDTDRNAGRFGVAARYVF